MENEATSPVRKHQDDDDHETLPPTPESFATRTTKEEVSEEEAPKLAQESHPTPTTHEVPTPAVAAPEPVVEEAPASSSAASAATHEIKQEQAAAVPTVAPSPAVAAPEPMVLVVPAPAPKPVVVPAPAPAPPVAAPAPAPPVATKTAFPKPTGLPSMFGGGGDGSSMQSTSSLSSVEEEEEVITKPPPTPDLFAKTQSPDEPPTPESYATRTTVSTVEEHNETGSETSSFYSVEEEKQQEEKPPKLSIAERTARQVARYPKTCFWTSFLSVLTLSALAMLLGDFSISVEMIGWPSRGTLVSNRQTQLHLLNRNRKNLAKLDSDCLWQDLTSVVQLGWETWSRGEADQIRADERGCKTEAHHRRLKEDPAMAAEWLRKSQEEQTDASIVVTARKNLTTLLNDCDVGWYTDPQLIVHEKLWPIWKLKSSDPEASILDPPRLQELCEAEENTQRILQERGYCFGCHDQQECLPPYSPVLYARLTVRNGFTKDCEELAQAWAPHQHKTEERWKECIAYILDVGTGEWARDKGPCPDIFAPSLVDKDFAETGKVRYTSSVFLTDANDVDEMYEIVDQFDKGSEHLEGAYDTQQNKFLVYEANAVMYRDISLAVASAMVTMMAMLVHTRSPFLTLVGIIQIALSFPLAYGVYRFIGGVEFFSFMNLIGLFVAFALGADHIFVAVDKWKNARRERPNATTEQVAIQALPSAAGGMALTTITTAVAFFGTALCPVTPIRLFGVFCGLLVALDYCVDVLVMFPCLCIFDAYRHTPNYFIDWRARKPEEEEEQEPEREPTPSSPELETEIDEKVVHVEDGIIGEGRLATISQESPSLAGTPSEEGNIEPNCIQHSLGSYYNVIHNFRWPLFVVCVTALVLCSYAASKFEVPSSISDIQILVPDNEFEKAKRWRMELFIQTLVIQAGSLAHVSWGLTPADTGDYNDPLTFSTLELDDTFDPSTEEAQVYMRDFCDRWFEQEFAEVPDDEFEWYTKKFDDWLDVQSSLPVENRTAIYIDNCGGASGIPVPEGSFHACLSSWAHQVDDRDILSWNGTVKIITLPFNSRVRIDSANKELGTEWRLLEDWMQADQQSNAPPEVSNAFFSSLDFWWWDTSYHVYRSALDSALLAIAVSAVVMLLSSRSISMTFFSSISVFYVLASVTAMMKAAGWTLGFLESVCFTILIGLSADFVIHFSHAYTEPPGNTDRHTRTKYALLHLGPSVLAAAFTTLAAAMVMLFCVVYFFRIFAMVLLFTIIQATAGSFVVFLVMTECFGPANPTYLFTQLCSLCGNSSLCGTSEEAKRKRAKRAKEREEGKLVRVDARANFKQREKEHREYLDQKKMRKKQERRARERSTTDETYC